jgi:hypothetical protein
VYVCDQCVSDPALQEFIRANASATSCDYCGREAEAPIACLFDEFAEALRDGFEVDWGNALEYMPFDGGDWAIPGAQIDTWDLLEHYPLELEEELHRDVVEYFDDVTWAPRYFFGVAPDERLQFSWASFVDYVSHHARYLFLSTGEAHDEYDETIPVSDVLRALGDAVREAEIVRPLPEGTVLYRARAHARDDRPENASELGAPPAQYARTSSRMSPNGIAMFYGALDEETALKESGGRGIAWHLTLATFEVGPGFQVLDLGDPPPAPSVFDAEHRHLIAPLRFLHVFVEEVRKRIRRDEAEHLEYVPTQIVAEYFRHMYERQTGERVNGIAYRSAIAPNGANVVLFIGNDDCVDEFGTDATRKVRLTSFKHLSAVGHRGRCAHSRGRSARGDGPVSSTR